MTTLRMRPAGVPYSNGVPTPAQCQLWSWVKGAHVRCPNLATVASKEPGRITLQVCAACAVKRKGETA